MIRKSKAVKAKVSSIEKKYGIDLGVRSDMKVSTYLRKQGFGPLADILDNK